MSAGLAIAAVLFSGQAASVDGHEVVTGVTLQEAEALWLEQTGDRLSGAAPSDPASFRARFIRHNWLDGSLSGRDCTGAGTQLRCSTIEFQKLRTTVTCTAMELIAQSVIRDGFIQITQTPGLNSGDRSTVTIKRTISLEGGVTRAHLQAVMRQFGKVAHRFDQEADRLGELKVIETSGPPREFMPAARPGPCDRTAATE